VGQEYTATHHFENIATFFLCIFGPSPALTCFIENLEETLLTCGSYSPGCQWNFHNLEVTSQAGIFFQFIYLYFYRKIVVLHVGEGSNLDPSPIHLACQHGALVLLVHCDQRGGGLTFVVVGTVGQSFIARGDATKLVYFNPMNKDEVQHVSAEMRSTLSTNCSLNIIISSGHMRCIRQCLFQV